MVKVCPSCGRTEREVPFIGFFCRDCYLRDHQLVEVPKLRLKRCPLCGRAYFSGRWEDFSLDRLRDWLVDHIKVREMQGVQIGVSFPEVDEDLIRYRAIVRGTVEGTPVEIPLEGEIPIEKVLCPRCGRATGGYFQAIIQVRGADVEKHAEEIARLVEREGGEYAFVSRVEFTKDGIDLYIGSKKVADKVARKIERRYGIKAIRSHRLITEIQGKRVYRLTVSLRFPPKD